MIEYASSQVDEPLRVAGLVMDIPAGHQLAESLKKNTEANGGTYLGDVTIPIAEISGDWRAQAQKLAELKPNVIGALSAAANAQTFLPAIANAGLEDSFVGGITLMGADAQNWLVAPESLHYFAISSTYVLDTVPEPDTATRIKDLAASASDSGAANNQNFVQGIVAANLVADAINATTGDEITAESVNEALASLGAWNAGGLSAPMCFGPGDTYGPTALWSVELNPKNSKFEIVGEAPTGDQTCS